MLFTICALKAASPLFAQRPPDWITAGHDSQRSSWVRGDPKISIATMAKPGFELVWQIKLSNEARQLISLTPPALFDFLIGYRGFRSLGFVGGSSERIFTLDVDLGTIEWEKNLTSNSDAPTSLLCPGGMTSSLTRPTFAAYPPVGVIRGFGRVSPAKSGVGEPHEGAVTLKERSLQSSAPQPPVAPPGRRTAPVTNPYGPTPQFVHAVTADGKFHALYASNGEEPNPPIPFLPPNANARGLIVFDNTAYAATVNGCSGADDGLWALNLESHNVTHWKSSSAVAGSAGFAVGPDGTLYVATADGELVALEPGTLTVKTSYKAGKALASSPVVFEYKDKDLIAVATRDGQIHLLDSAAMAGPPLATTPAFSASDFAIGALASWQDSAGTRWIVAPAGGPVAAAAGFESGNGEVSTGAVVAFAIAEENGAPTLRPRWVSRELVSPVTPTIVNGVIFALSSGEFRSTDPQLSAEQRAQRSSPAVLYALDGATGKELWNSGSTITSFVHSGGLSAGGGRVYVGGHDGTLYAFGFPMEH
jgi:outer membrane protein assembly factor BamB